MTTDFTLPLSVLSQLPPARTGARLRVLYFMRTIDCPICRSHVKRLGALSPSLAPLGADIVVYAPSAGAELAGDWIAAQPFPVIATDDVHEQAGLARAVFGRVQQSGTMLVDEAGRVLLARRATLPFQAFDERELVAALREAAFSAAPRAA